MMMMMIIIFIIVIIIIKFLFLMSIILTKNHPGEMWLSAIWFVTASLSCQMMIAFTMEAIIATTSRLCASVSA